MLLVSGKDTTISLIWCPLQIFSSCSLYCPAELGRRCGRRAVLPRLATPSNVYPYWELPAAAAHPLISQAGVGSKWHWGLQGCSLNKETRGENVSTFESVSSPWQTELEKVWLSEAVQLLSTSRMPLHVLECLSYADKPLLAFLPCEKGDENYSPCSPGFVCHSSAVAAVVLP